MKIYLYICLKIYVKVSSSSSYKSCNFIKHVTFPKKFSLRKCRVIDTNSS